jgi:hypothetical protein
MSEVQAHGKLWERELALNVYRCSPKELSSVNYTATHDIPGEINHLEPGVSVSIKASCSNTICMGDVIRVFDTVSSGNRLHLTILLYEQDCAAGTKTIKDIFELNITGSSELLFGTVTRADLQSLITLMHAVPKELRGRIVVEGKKISAPSPQRQAYLEKQVELLEKSGLIILNPKLDETNCRLQCSINLKKIIDTKPGLIVSHSSNEEFRGGYITRVINSGSRQFTKKRSLENAEWANASTKEGILESMTVTQLKKGATLASVSKTGKKEELISRLREHFSAQCSPCGGCGGGSSSEGSKGGSRKSRKNRK